MTPARDDSGARSPDEERDIEPDRLIGSYEILDKLGEGSMGVVYKARHLAMDRIVAVKLLAGWLSRDRKYVARFFREARLAAKLDHPNIVRGIDAGSEGRTHYFVMEYVEGETLGSLLRRGRRFPEKSALRVTMHVANALAHAWKHGLVHRDVKPDNIILTKRGGVKLADLGLAKSISGDATQMTQTGTSVGTPYYMSPEQVRGDREIDVRSDIYSLGATLYHLVTGYTPFTASTPLLVLNKQLTEIPEPAHVRSSKVSAHTSAVIDKMMAKDPAERYQDPAELMEDIALVVKGNAPEHAVPVDREGRVVAATQSLIGVKELRRAEMTVGWKVPLAAAAGAALVVLALFFAFRRTGAGKGTPDSEPAQAALVASEAERKKLVEADEKLASLTAADLVGPRQEAREAKREAGKAPREHAVENLFERMEKLWGGAEGALAAGDLPKAFVSYRGCREAAEAITTRRRDMEACVKAAEEARAARGASEELSQYAPTEWRVAEEAFRAAEGKRLAGEFADAARGYAAAKQAYEEHRRQAVELARERALARAREAEARGDRKGALAAYREAAPYGADVAGKIAELEDKLARGEAMERARALVDRRRWKEAAAVLVDMLRRSPGDERASSLLADVTEQVRKERPLEMDLGGGVKMELVYVLPGNFKMGSADGDSDERPVHEVWITKGFYLGKTEVTQAQYERVTGRNPSYWKDPARPVERVSWEDAVEFCGKLSEKTGKSFRLPTEAEWEYAARAGSSGRYCFGDDAKEVSEYAWYAANSSRETHPAGSKKPNAWGLRDTHGNVWEWCADVYNPGFYAVSPAEDPCCSADGERRVVRGGSWLSKARHCRSAERIRYRPKARYADVGFRVVCETR